ncbi:hypothetical protein ISN76_09490 [Dyella halodurans]|uniref:Lipoprotein n=1 Tax=Dyella halodurans TaxID=1920171 RepID=A0ABV9C1V0_9GAMM|nr:hypothetical protein [Dyella halodurans]
MAGTPASSVITVLAECAPPKQRAPVPAGDSSEDAIAAGNENAQRAMQIN